MLGYWSINFQILENIERFGEELLDVPGSHPNKTEVFDE